MRFENFLPTILLFSILSCVSADPRTSSKVVMHLPFKEHKHVHTVYETVHHYVPLDSKMLGEDAAITKTVGEHTSESRNEPTITSTKLFPTTVDDIDVHRPKARGRYIPIKDSLVEQRLEAGARPMTAIGPPRFVKRKLPKKYVPDHDRPLQHAASSHSIRVIKQVPYVPAHFEYYTTYNSDNRPNTWKANKFKPVMQTADFRPLKFNYEPVKPSQSYPVHHQGPNQHYHEQYNGPSQQSNGGNYGGQYETVTQSYKQNDGPSQQSYSGNYGGQYETVTQTYKQNDGVLYTDGSYDLQTNYGHGQKGGQSVYHAPVTIEQRPDLNTDEEESFQIQKPKTVSTAQPATVSYHFQQEHQPVADKFQIYVEDEVKPTQPASEPVRSAPVRNAPVRKAPPRREPVRHQAPVQETTTTRARPTSSSTQQRDPPKSRPLRTRGQSRFQNSNLELEGVAPVRSRPSKNEDAPSDISPDDNYPPGVISQALQSAPKKGKRKLVRKRPKEQRDNGAESQRREDQDVNPTRNSVLWASQWMPIFRNFNTKWESSSGEPKLQDLIDRNDVGVEKEQLVGRISKIPHSMLRRQKIYIIPR